MLDITVTITGQTAVIEGLNQMSQAIPGAVNKALTRSAAGIFRDAFAYLSGPGAKGISKEVRSKRTGKKYLKWNKQSIPAGGYPVPVRTGWLRKQLAWLKPGESKTGEIGTFTAGPMEVVIFDSAQYADPIHEGTGSSAKFGRRPFLTGAFEKFNQGGRIREIILEEIMKVKK